MIYATPQGAHAHSELQHAIKQAKSAKWYRRLKIIQLSMSGVSVSQLSHQFDLCPIVQVFFCKKYSEGAVCVSDYWSENLIYIFAASQSSLISLMIAVTNLRHEASFGKIETTCVRRLISRLSRSRPLVVRINR